MRGRSCSISSVSYTHLDVYKRQTLGDGTDTCKARVIMRDGEYPAVPAQSPVFTDYAFGDVKQADIGTRSEERRVGKEC